MSAVAHFFVVVGGSIIHERMAHFFIDIYIGKWLISNYALEDRRGNIEYKYWEMVSLERKKWANVD